MVANFHCLLGVAIGWKVNRTVLVAVHCTDSEVRAYFQSSKLTKLYRSLLTSIGIHLQIPTQSVISIVTDAHMIPIVKHIDIPVFYSQEQHILGNSSPHYKPSRLLLTDSSTKPVSGPVLKKHSYFLFGVKFYPPPGSQHYQQLTLDSYGLSYTEILTNYSSKSLSYPLKMGVLDYSPATGPPYCIFLPTYC